MDAISALLTVLRRRRIRCCAPERDPVSGRERLAMVVVRPSMCQDSPVARGPPQQLPADFACESNEYLICLSHGIQRSDSNVMDSSN